MCSDLHNCRPAQDFEDLEKRRSLSEEKLRSHCKQDSRPSEWISMSDDVTWVFKQIAQKWPYGGAFVSFVSRAKMERLNVLFDRSYSLVRYAGGETFNKKHPKGVNYAWSAHYLAYGWIPVQCVMKTITSTEFIGLYEKQRVQAGQCP